MSKRIFRSIREPKREGLSWEERWKDDDQGLIACWEVGRDLRQNDPSLASRAENGELPTGLGWKGGAAAKTNVKHGSLFYLAQWQGLRGEDLDIDMSKQTSITCTKTGITITYHRDPIKWGAT